MDNVFSALRRVFGIGLSWAVLWLGLWVGVGAIIGIVDPDSIDPGDSEGLVKTMGSMGLLAGLAFGILMSKGRSRPSVDHSLIRAAAYGLLGSAIAQLPYLDHGNLGLAANIKMALLCTVIGGIVTVVWFGLDRTWLQWRSSHRPTNDAA